MEKKTAKLLRVEEMRRVRGEKHVDSWETFGHPAITPALSRREEWQWPQEGLGICLQRGPMLSSLWEPGEARRAWSGNVHLVLPDRQAQDQCLIFLFTPTRCRCFSTISACLRAAPSFLGLEIITGFQEEFSPKWIKPWILADSDQDIPAETGRDQQPGTTVSICPFQPLTPPHHALWEASQTSTQPWSEKKPWSDLETFLLPSRIGDL